MDRTAFEYIFIHANSLAEISLLRCASRIEQEFAALPDPIAELSDEERDAIVNANLDKMRKDYEAGVKSPLDEFHEEFRAKYASQPLAPYVEPPLVERGIGRHEEDASGEFDLSIYLDRAYSASAQIAERVDRAMREIDLAELEALLAALPAALPPLTAPMDAAGFEQWLALNDEMNEALNDVITSIRFIDFEM